MATQHGTTETVLVTGASSGIGQATARIFADSGYRVFGTSRHERPDERGVEMLVMDMRSAESVARCVTEALDRAGCIDVLVNNAGVTHRGFAEETTTAEAEDMFAINLFGPARVTNAVLPGMRARRHGRIITVGSLAAWIGEPGEGFYAASKAALARYTQALRHEVWPLGIAVSLVEPGAFATGVLQASSTTDPGITDYDGAREAARRRIDESLRRGGDPHEAASLILRIARARSPRFRYGAGVDGRWVPLLLTLMPQRLTDHLVRRSFGLEAHRRTQRGHPDAAGESPNG